MTALPLIETLEGEVSAYIPTNVISITDGQIYLEPDLFFAGVRPAVNVGISVSRVGGNAQVKAMKKIAGTLRLDLASFRELEAFAQLGTELDKATQRQLDRGYRMVELLKQPQYKPYPIEDQVVSIFAGTKGFLDDLPVSGVAAFEHEMLKHFRDEYSELLTEIKEGVISDELAERLSRRSPTSRATTRRRTRLSIARRITAMANRRVLVKRRKAARNIRKITRTMQLIATARFQAAHNRATAGKPYTEKLTQLMENLARAAGGAGASADGPQPRSRARRPAGADLEPRSCAAATTPTCCAPPASFSPPPSSRSMSAWWARRASLSSAFSATRWPRRSPTSPTRRASTRSSRWPTG